MGAAVDSGLTALADAAGNGAFRRVVKPAVGRASTDFLTTDFYLRDCTGSEGAASGVSESFDNSDEEVEETSTNLDDIDFFAEAVDSERFGFVARATAFGSSGSTAKTTNSSSRLKHVCGQETPASQVVGPPRQRPRV